MINELDMRKLKFIVTPTRSYDPSLNHEMKLAYECWKEVWGKTFHDELNVKEHLFSDNFTRQSELAIIFHGERPLGLCTLNRFDLRLQQDLDDSYFQVWPREVLEELKSHMNIVMSCCNATISYEYRKNNLGVPSIDLLFGMVVRYLKSSVAEGVLGTARVQKKVPEACERTNATFFAKNIPYTIPGATIDLICWKKDLDMSKWDTELLALTEFIWKRSTTIYKSAEGEKYAA